MKLIQYLILAGLGLVLLYTLALGTRRAVLESQYRKLGDDLPFTLESALQYRRVKIIHDTGSLPVRDVMVQYPEGVNTRTSYTLGSEYLYAALSNLFPDHMPFANRLRWLEAGWFCLGIPLLALWLRVWRRSWWAAGTGAAFYAVALSAVIRSTGQELSRENFALPILLAHYLCDAASQRAGGTVRRLGLQLGSALLLGLALSCWDLIQYPVLLRMGWMSWRAWRGSASAKDPVFQGWCIQAAVLALVGLVHPYYRSHGWLLSPAMLMAYATLGLAGLRQARAARWRVWAEGFRRSTLTWLGLFALGSLVGHVTAYGQAYRHFGSLFWAKLRYLNVKPEDPALLSFDQRIMWVPALHSAHWGLLQTLFPAILYLTFIAILLVFISFRKRPDQKVGELLFSTVASFIAFWFFARFHVYLALFASALLGVWAGQVGQYRTLGRWIAGILLATGWSVEAMHTLQRPERWGRINVYYKELDELADWLHEHVAPEPVLANFGASAYIATYGKCPIVLHPKFEDRVIRDRVKAYGEQLFSGTEQSFRDWADDVGVRYYVYAYGEFARESPELQMRYFVNAMNPPDRVPARLFEAGARDLTYFRYRWSNHKYAVYQILTRAEERAAEDWTAKARAAFESGDVAAAEAACVEALRLHPKLLAAAEIMASIERLRDAGFRHQPSGD